MWIYFWNKTFQCCRCCNLPYEMWFPYTDSLRQLTHATETLTHTNVKVVCTLVRPLNVVLVYGLHYAKVARTLITQVCIVVVDWFVVVRMSFNTCLGVPLCQVCTDMSPLRETFCLGA